MVDGGPQQANGRAPSPGPSGGLTRSQRHGALFFWILLAVVIALAFVEMVTGMRFIP